MTSTNDDLSARADLTGIQRRSIALTDFEFRDVSSDEWSFEGLACTVDHPYQVRDWLGEFTETIKPGAFNRSINDPQAKISLHLNHQHGRAIPLAVRSAQASTLRVAADPHLRLSASLDPSRPDVQMARSAIKRGEMTEMSIGFTDVKGGVEWDATYTARAVNDLRLREASIVEDGCNDLTSAAVRSLAQEIARFRGETDPAEVRRAIAYLEAMLPTDVTADEVGDTIERSGLVVTDEFIRLYELRFNAA